MANQTFRLHGLGGYLFFFDQLMTQNQDLKDTIEASMRKFMSDNMKLELARRFYVPKSTYEKYMRTNEY